MRHSVETSRERVKPLSLKHLEIEFLFCLAAFLFLFLVIFGSFRRSCNNEYFRVMNFAAYALSGFVLTYDLSLMKGCHLKNEFIAEWAIFLMFVFASKDCFSAFRLEDNEQWKKYNWQSVARFAALGLVLAFRATPPYRMAAPPLVIVLLLKSHQRALALASASTRWLKRSTKVIYDHMQQRAEAAVAGDFKLTNCYYVVRGEEDKLDLWDYLSHFWKKRKLPTKEPAGVAPKYWTPLDTTRGDVITVEKVWNCEGELLSKEDPDNRLKDYCLSFALFKLLRMKYAGYSLPQQDHRRSWILIKNELLDDYKRAFRVIETELSYLFDFFYTKYPIIFHPGRWKLKVIELVLFSVGILATSNILKNACRKDTCLTGNCNHDAIISLITILAFVSLELLQFCLVLFSEWAKLMYICNYVEKEKWQKRKWIERVVKFMCRPPIFPLWESKLHQYSFLESYSYKSWGWGLVYNRITALYYDQVRDGQRESKSIDLSEEVKKAVFDTLKSKSPGRTLKNGKATLEKHHVLELLSWACEPKTQTQVILVWHIATSFCEKEKPFHLLETETARKNFRIATNLSKYLAYLVVFHPRLLPDYTHAAEYMFDQVIHEAKNFFKNCTPKCKNKDKKMTAQIEKMRNHARTHPEEQTVISLGAWLGKQIVDRSNRMNSMEARSMTTSLFEARSAEVHQMSSMEIRSSAMSSNEAWIWEILADFWVEMMLYVAPSDDIKAHAEQLTQGGEFVTHLWALLYHAGIEREVPSEEIPTEA